MSWKLLWVQVMGRWKYRSRWEVPEFTRGSTKGKEREGVGKGDRKSLRVNMCEGKCVGGRPQDGNEDDWVREGSKSHVVNGLNCGKDTERKRKEERG